MWFSLFTIVLICAMTFFQGLQGLFSAVITCVLTVLSAALAFGLYEDLYYWQLVAYQPDHGRAIALMAIFIISLLVLRGLFDALISGNMRFPVYVDRVGGGLFGFVSAMVTVGMLAIAVQMLPFGYSFLGFSRFVMIDIPSRTVLVPPDENTAEFWLNINFGEVEYKRRNLAGFLNPDGFTLGLIGRLSDNALAGRNRFHEFYPDFQRLLAGLHGRHSTESRVTAPPTALKAEGYWYLSGKTPQDSLYVRRPATEKQPDNAPTPPEGQRGVPVKLERYQPADGEGRFLVVRAAIDYEARDPDNQHRFTTEQVRLVAVEGKAGKVREFYLAGVNHDYQPTGKAERNPGRWVKLDRGECIVRSAESQPLAIDLVFMVPANPEFKPLFVEYKLNARAFLNPAMDRSDKIPAPLPPPKPPRTDDDQRPDESETSAPPPPETSAGPPPSPPQDRVSGLGPTREAIFSNLMPFRLTDYSGTDIELRGSELVGGYVRAVLDDDWKPRDGDKAPIESFQVPEGLRMLQVSVEKLQPQSWLGGVLGTAIDSVQNFYLIAEGGGQYPPVGMYAWAEVGGQKVFELRYLDETARGMARLPKFEKIRARDLTRDYGLFFLFHVPPGTRPKEINTGRRKVDLSQFNLVAPR